MSEQPAKPFEEMSIRQLRAETEKIGYKWGTSDSKRDLLRVLYDYAECLRITQDMDRMREELLHDPKVRIGASVLRARQSE